MKRVLRAFGFGCLIWLAIAAFLAYFLGPLALEMWLLPNPDVTGQPWPYFVLIATFILQMCVLVGAAREFDR